MSGSAQSIQGAPEALPTTEAPSREELLSQIKKNLQQQGIEGGDISLAYPDPQAGTGETNGRTVIPLKSANLDELDNLPKPQLEALAGAAQEGRLTVVDGTMNAANETLTAQDTGGAAPAVLTASKEPSRLPPDPVIEIDSAARGRFPSTPTTPEGVGSTEATSQPTFTAEPVESSGRAEGKKTSESEVKYPLETLTKETVRKGGKERLKVYTMVESPGGNKYRLVRHFPPGTSDAKIQKKFNESYHRTKALAEAYKLGEKPGGTKRLEISKGSLTLDYYEKKGWGPFKSKRVRDRLEGKLSTDITFKAADLEKTKVPTKERQLYELDAKISKVGKESKITDMQAKIDELDVRIKSGKEDPKIRKLEKEIAKRQEKKERIGKEAKASQLQAEIDQLNADIEGLARDPTKAKKAEKARKRLAKIQKKMDTLPPDTKTPKELQRLDDEIATLTTEREACIDGEPNKQLVEKLKTEKTKLEGKLDTLKRVDEKRQQKLDKLKDKRTALVEELDKCKKDPVYQDLEKTKTNLEAAYKALITDIYEKHKEKKRELDCELQTVESSSSDET